MRRRIGRSHAVAGLAVLVALGGVSAIRSVEAGATAEMEARMTARGLEVYREQRCGACHTFTRAGTRGIFGPGHDSAAVMAERRVHDPGYRGEATSAAEYLRESITDPGAYRVPGFERTHFNMPDYSELPPEDLDALVFVLSREPQ